jgi:hypothetical protein
VRKEDENRRGREVREEVKMHSRPYRSTAQHSTEQQCNAAQRFDSIGKVR